MLACDISSVNYKIYVNKQGWNLIEVVKNNFDAINIIEEIVKNKIKVLIVFHDLDIDSDYEWHIIDSKQKLEELKEKLLNVPRGTKKIYTRKK